MALGEIPWEIRIGHGNGAFHVTFEIESLHCLLSCSLHFLKHCNRHISRIAEALMQMFCPFESFGPCGPIAQESGSEGMKLQAARKRGRPVIGRRFRSHVARLLLV